MNTAFQQAMAEATRLTHAGDLRAATALIQAALAGASSRAPRHQAPPPGAPWDVIDVQARVIDDATALRLPGGACDPVRPAPAADAPAVQAARAGMDALSGAAVRPPSGRARPAAAEPQPAPVVEPVPARVGGDSFVEGSHTEAGLTRGYKLYVPPEHHGSGLPLVVMLHGCTQHPDDFAIGTGMNAAAREQGFYVLYPAQAQKANPSRCWNWFKHNHQARGRGEPALLAGMTRAVIDRHGIDPQRVYVAGLSAGGAMAAILGVAYPDLFAAVGVHSGLPAGAARDLPSALAAMHGAAPGAAGAANLADLPDLKSLKGLKGLKDLPGLKDLKHLKDLRALADLPGMADLADLPGMTGLPGWDGLDGADATVCVDEPPAPCGPVPPTIVFHGDRDGTVHPANGERAVTACTDAAAATHTERGHSPGGRTYTRRIWRDAAGQPRAEHWTVHGAGHAWSGGHPGGSYTDASGPDATAAMLRFFQAQRLRRAD
jgi:poly(hydroxyalkanoate) depolymerase family esterase